MKYTILLKKIESPENFDEKRDNIVYINVKTIAGKNITNESKVTILLNKDSMLGLGKSLIRYAYEKEKVGGPFHFSPIRPNEGIIETFGIILLPQSAALILGENIDKPIDDYLNKIKDNVWFMNL